MKPSINRPLFLTSRRPYRIRSVLLAVVVGVALGFFLAGAL